MIPRSLSSSTLFGVVPEVRRSLSRIVVGRRAESVIITDNFIASDGSRGQAVHHMRKANGPGCDLFDPTDPNRGHRSGNPRTASNPSSAGSSTASRGAAMGWTPERVRNFL